MSTIGDHVVFFLPRDLGRVLLRNQAMQDATALGTDSYAREQRINDNERLEDCYFCLQATI